MSSFGGAFRLPSKGIKGIVPLSCGCVLSEASVFSMGLVGFFSLEHVGEVAVAAVVVESISSVHSERISVYAKRILSLRGEETVDFHLA